MTCCEIDHSHTLFRLHSRDVGLGARCPAGVFVEGDVRPSGPSWWRSSGRIAEREPDLTDDQIVELVARLLDCPEDAELLVGARLRYAVEQYRNRSE